MPARSALGLFLGAQVLLVASRPPGACCCWRCMRFVHGLAARPWWLSSSAPAAPGRQRDPCRHVGGVPGGGVWASRMVVSSSSRLRSGPSVQGDRLGIFDLLVFGLLLVALPGGGPSPGARACWSPSSPLVAPAAVAAGGCPAATSCSIGIQWPTGPRARRSTWSRCRPSRRTSSSAALLGGRHLPPPLQARLAATAEGNPLFLTETVAMLVEDGRIRQSDDGWDFEAGLADVPIRPPSRRSSPRAWTS